MIQRFQFNAQFSWKGTSFKPIRET